MKADDNEKKKEKCCQTRVDCVIGVEGYNNRTLGIKGKVDAAVPPTRVTRKSGWML